MEHTYLFDDGTEVTLQDIPPMMLMQTIQSEAGKPPVPIVEVDIRGHKRKQSNPDDPDYLVAVNRWEEAKNNRLVQLLILRGVADDPPDDFVDAYRSVLDPAAGIDEFKCLWVASLMPNG